MRKHEKPSSINQEHEQELAGPFLVVLAVLTVIAFLLPLRPSTSMRERRVLRSFPAFTTESFLSGDYFDGITAWFSDTFPGREIMLAVSEQLSAMHGLNTNEVVLTQNAAGSDSANLDELMEKAEAAAAAASSAPMEETVQPAPTEEAESPAPPQIADADAVVEKWGGLQADEEANMFTDLIVIDGTAMSRMGFDQVTTDRHVRLMNRAGDALAEKGIRFFNLPVPTAVSVLLSSDMVEKVKTADQGKILRYMFAQENENVCKVNVFNNLLAHNSEYLYYHSDHHWTALGAYYGYEAFCEEAGWEPVPLEEYREWNMGEFVGTYTYSVNANKLKPDEMIAYVPPGTIRMKIPAYPDADTVIVDESGSSPSMKYNCFLDGDNPQTVITNENLPDAPDCLVIKDSFGNPFIIYLTQHYHNIYVLDYRSNFTPVSTVAEEYGVSDVILVQSIGVTQTQNAQFLLENLMK